MVSPCRTLQSWNSWRNSIASLAWFKASCMAPSRAFSRREFRVSCGGEAGQGAAKNSTVVAGLVPATPLGHAPAVAQYYLYILASRPGGALYVGVTRALIRRVYEHRTGVIEGHTKRYHIHR